MQIDQKKVLSILVQTQHILRLSLNNGAMKKPPPKKITQEDYVKTAVRLPPELYVRIKDLAERNGHSMNGELIALLHAALSETKLDTIGRTATEIKKMVRELLDK
jgi:HAMP domain-containing protein